MDVQKFYGLSRLQINQLLKLDYPSESPEIQLVLSMMAQHIETWSEATKEGETKTMSRMLRDVLACSKQLRKLLAEDQGDDDVSAWLSAGQS